MVNSDRYSRQGRDSSPGGKGTRVPTLLQLTKGMGSDERTSSKLYKVTLGKSRTIPLPPVTLSPPSRAAFLFFQDHNSQDMSVQPDKSASPIWLWPHTTSWLISPKPCLSHALHFPAQKPYTAPHNSPNSLPTIYRQPTLLNYLLFSPSAHSKSIRHTVSELLSSEPGWGQGESWR